ncbi:hypothetical protein DFR29_111148 [Tahibacter aquaticus]|uniref:Uncharacterized protein n=1 Tax=Tahibacter aquaticus TaxID=520092 RepID=A0A4V3DLT3_9GAMM|nr:hypothetical protein DFR29_111148 [Tahibacter aquaticus]
MPYCVAQDDFDRPVASQLLPDGRAWLLHSRHSEDVESLTLRQINASGAVAAAIGIPVPAGASVRMLSATADDAVVVLGSDGFE